MGAVKIFPLPGPLLQRTLIPPLLLFYGHGVNRERSVYMEEGIGKTIEKCHCNVKGKSRARNSWVGVEKVPQFCLND